jgi:hypothetical protein
MPHASNITYNLRNGTPDLDVGGDENSLPRVASPAAPIAHVTSMTLPHGSADAEPVSQQPVISITGELVALGPAHRGLLPLVWRWENDVALSLLTGDPARPLAPEAIEADYERYEGKSAGYGAIRRVPARHVAPGRDDGPQPHRLSASHRQVRHRHPDSWGKG